MKSIEIYTSIDIEAPPEQVWGWLVDLENLDSWMLEGSDFVVIGDRREGVGVEAEATIRIGGLKTRDRIRVNRWEPPESFGIEHLGWVKGQGLLRCYQIPRGTHLMWIETLVPPLGVLGAVGIRVFKPVMRRIFQRDLEELKRLVERV